MADEPITTVGIPAKRIRKKVPCTTETTSAGVKPPSAYALRCAKMSPEELKAFFHKKCETERVRVKNFTPEQVDARNSYFRDYYEHNKEEIHLKTKGADKRRLENMAPDRLAEYRETKKLKEAHRRKTTDPAVLAAQRRKSREKTLQKILSDPVLHESHRATSRARSARNRKNRTEQQRVQMNALNRARKARQSGAEGRYTAEDVANILEMQHGKCAICGKPIGKRFHVDHIVPVASGGSNWPKNLQVTHPKCNVAKSATDPIIFMRRMGKLL